MSFSVCVGGHIRVWILFYFYIIILFSRLIWDSSMSEELSPLAPDCYRVSHLYYILFYHFTVSYLILVI
jgi:hypothetical protein